MVYNETSLHVSNVVNSSNLDSISRFLSSNSERSDWIVNVSEAISLSNICTLDISLGGICEKDLIKSSSMWTSLVDATEGDDNGGEDSFLEIVEFSSLGESFAARLNGVCNKGESNLDELLIDDSTSLLTSLNTGSLNRDDV